jgi:hypothetical protein
MATTYHTMDVYSTANDVFWQLGVEPGEQNRMLVTWGCHVHDRATRCLIVEAAIRAVVGQQHITRVVEDCWYKLMHVELSASAQILYHCSTSSRITQF